MYKHLFTIALAVPAFLLAASGKRLIGVGQMGNDVVDIAATVLEDRQSCTEAIGSDPGMDIIVVKLRFHVKGDNKISLWKDDFTLLSGKDGQRSQPLAPSEIAGHMSLIVTENGVRSASGPSHRPSFGGIGLGGQMGGVGNSAPATQAEAKIEDKSQEPENPVLAVLKEKAIPEKEVTDSEEGLLYFLLDGKPPKPKELTLIYKSSGGRVLLDFK